MVQRRNLAAVGLALGLAIGLGACANAQSRPATQRADVSSNAPARPDFDVAKIDEIVPGLTPQQQIRDWFGEPDWRQERRDGTAQWLYSKARMRREEPWSAAQREAEEERARAADARRLREGARALAAAGRRQLGRFFGWVEGWVERVVFYPPRPRRADPAVAAEPPAPQTGVERAAAPRRDETAEAEGPRQPEDAGEAVMQFDLAVSFARDGVVDEFRYQRSAGREGTP